MSVTIIGAGSMGSAIAQVALAAGSDVQVLARDAAKAAVDERVTAGTVGDEPTGDVVVLALPYGALPEVLDTYAGRLDGRVLVDICNPVDQATFDGLEVPDGESSASLLAQRVPEAAVLKAFNTNFASTLAEGTVGPLPTTVLVAGDDADAKERFVAAFGSGAVRVVDAGSLKRALELERLGFLQISLAAGGQTSWGAGFALA